MEMEYHSGNLTQQKEGFDPGSGVRAGEEAGVVKGMMVLNHGSMF